MGIDHEVYHEWSDSEGTFNSLPTRSNERGVLGVVSIPVAIYSPLVKIENYCILTTYKDINYI